MLPSLTAWYKHILFYVTETFSKAKVVELLILVENKALHCQFLSFARYVHISLESVG